MKTRFNAILLLSLLLLAGCNPLRRMQSNQKVDSTTVDRSEIHKIVTDILRESGTLSQTVVEFYPPGNTPPPAERPEPPGDKAILAEPTTVTPPAIRRIVKTEISTESERTITTDSTANNDIRTVAHSELSDKVVEKPPATVQAIKWIAVGLVALLLVIVILKFSKIKIPGL